MTLGQKIKRLRTERGLTQKELADQLHVTFQTISKWESDTNEPDFTTLKEIANFFNVSLDFIADENEDAIHVSVPQEDIIPVAPINATSENTQPVQMEHQPVENRTIIIHEHDLRVCSRCGNDIPENELVSEDVTQKVREGRQTRTVTIGQSYYHRDCFEQVRAEREAEAERLRKQNFKRGSIRCFAWAIVAGVASLALALAFFLLNQDIAHPALGVLYSILFGYAIFSMIYCIRSDSYISDVFFWCATRSIKLPGLIFSLDLDGIILFILVKLSLAILGFLFGIAALIFGVILSSVLSMFSFPFILIHNIRTNYEDALLLG